MAKNKNVIKPAILIALLIVVFLVPLFAPNRVLVLFVPAFALAVACMGWTLIASVGQFSMGQAGFMALGGYAAMWMALEMGVPFGLNFLIGGLFCGVIAFLLGIAVLRIGGLYFAIVTLAFGFLVEIFATKLSGITNGVYGLVPQHPVLNIGGGMYSFAVTKAGYYYVCLIFLVIAAIIFWRMSSSRMGRIFKSISSNANQAEHTGQPLMKYRVIAFTVAGIMTGIAGGLFSYNMSFIGPTVYTMDTSIMILIMSTAGGVGSAVAGPIIGALVLSPLGDYLQILAGGIRPLVFGVIIVLIVFLIPNGLVSVKDYVKRLFNGKKKDSDAAGGTMTDVDGLTKST